MSIMLGEAHAKINLDISGLKSGASQAASILRGLDNLGSGAFGGMDKALSNLESQLAHVGQQQVTIDMTQAIGGTKQLAVAIEDVEAKIESASGASFTVDSAEATGALQQVALAVDDVASAVASSGGTVFGLNTAEAVAGLSQVRTEAQDAVAAIQAAGGVTLDVNASQAIASLTQVATATDDVMAQLAAADSATLAISVTRDQLDAASRAVQELRQTVGQNMTAMVSISGLGELDAATSQAIRTREAIGGIADAAPSISLGGLTGELDAAAASAHQLVSTLQGLGSIGIGAGFAGLLLAPLTQGIKTAAELEQSLKNVQVALGNVSNADMGRLDSAIRNVGTSTEFSSGQIAKVAESLAKAGNDASAILDGKMLPAVAALASATGTDLQTSVTGVVQAMAVWGPTMVDASIAMTDASRAADILTVAANQSSADIGDIIAGMRSLGPVASQLGVSFDEAAAAIAVFTNAGLSGADAGISIARGIQNLNDASSEARELMNELGITVFDVHGKFVGLESLFGQLSNSLQGMTQQQQQTAIATLFGAEAQDVFALAVAQGVDPLHAIVEAMQEQGVAMDQAAAKTDTLQGAWDRLKESASTALGGLAGGFVTPLTMLATVIDTVVSAFSSLPGAVQQGIGLLVGVGGAAIAAVSAFNLASMAVGRFGGLVGNVTGLSSMIAKLQQLASVAGVSRGGVMSLLGTLGPLAAVAAITGGALLLMHNSMKREEQAAKDLAASMTELADAIEMVRRKGNDTLADMTETLGKQLAEVPKKIQEIQQEILKTVEDPVAWRAARFNQLVEEGMSPADAVAQAMADWNAILPSVHVASEEIEAANKKIVSALNDPNIDANGFVMWAQGLLDAANAIEDPAEKAKALADAVHQINSRPLSDFATKADDAAAAMARLKKNFALDDLKIQGKFELAEQLKDVNEILDKIAFNWKTVTASGGRQSDAMSAMGISTSTLEHNNAALKVSAGLADEYAAAQQRISDAVATGNLDNQAVYEGLVAIEKQRVVNIAAGMDEAQANDLAGRAVVALSYGMSEYTKVLTAAQQAQVKFATSSDNILTTMERQRMMFRNVSTSYGEAGGTTLMLQTATQLDIAAKSLDRVQAIYEQIDNLSSRSSKSASIAENLVGSGGDIGELPGLMDRIANGTSRATLSQQEFSKAMASGNAIIQSNAQVQDLLLSVQAKQLPYLAAQQKQYENNIAGLEKMNAADQRRVLLLQDTTVQQGLASAAAIQQASAYNTLNQSQVDILVSQAIGNAQLFEALTLYGSLKVGADGYYQVLGANGQWVTSTIKAQTDAVTAQGEAAEVSAAAFAAGAPALNSAAAAALLAAAEMDRLKQAARDMLDSFHEMRGVDKVLGDWNLTAHATEASKLAENIQTTGYAIGNAKRQIIDNTDAIAQQVSGLNDWATGLTEVVDGVSALDTLLANGRIDQGQYDDAVAAQQQIAAANESIKQSVLDIQATAAPVLGDLTAQQAAYLEQLSAMPKEQQLVALGWMDSATNAKAYEIATQAAAVANGDFGASGEAAFNKMVQGAVTADPLLGAVLEDMGLISVGADGTVTVHYDTAKGATSEIAELTKSIDALTLALGGVPPLHLETNAKYAKSDIDAVRKALEGANKDIGATNEELIALANRKAHPEIDVVTDGVKDAIGDIGARIRDLDGLNATPKVGADTSGAEGPLDGVRDKLGGLDGRTITSRVKIIVDDQTGGGMGKYDQQGADAAAVHLKTILDPPEGIPDYSSVPPVPLKSKWEAVPPLELPIPEPYVVPVTFSVATAGGVGPTKVPGGMESALGGAGGADGSGITIAVNITVTGGDQLSAVKQAIDALKDKGVTVTASVTGAESIGALKLDVQNLSNKTVTITGDNVDAMQKWQAVQNLTNASRWLFLFGDNGDAMRKWQDVQNLTDASRWLFIFGDNSEALSAHDEVTKLPDVTRTLTINVVVNGSVPKFAAGGTVPSMGGNTTVARLAELGPELFRTPSGKWGMAMTDGLYPMMPGTYVFTAAQSRRMWEHWTGQSYARGGRVRRDTPTRGERARYSGGGGSTVITVHSRPNITVNPQTRVTDDDLSYIMTEVSDAAVTAVQTTRFAKGGS